MVSYTRYILTVLTSCLVFFDTVKAETELLESQIPSVSLKQLSKKVKRWTVDEGLGSDRIDSIAQTPDGHIWVGGFGGVARLNNGAFKRFNLKEILEQHVGNIDYMETDKSGKLWLFSRNKLIITFFGGRFSLCYPEESKGFGHVKATVSNKQFREGVIVFTRDEGTSKIYLLQSSRWEQLATLPESMGEILSADYNAHGELWFVDSRRRLFTFDIEVGTITEIGRKNSAESHAQRTYSKLFKDYRGQLLVADSIGVYSLESERLVLQRSFPKRLPARLIRNTANMDRDGNLWMTGEAKKIYIYKASGEMLEVSLRGSGFSPPVHKLFIDQSGTVWLGSFNGLYQIAYSPFVSWKLEKDSVPYRFVTVSEAGDKCMWFSCLGAVCYLPATGEQLEVVSLRRVSDRTLVLGTPLEGALTLNHAGSLNNYNPDLKNQFSKRLITSNPDNRLQVTGGVVTANGDLWVTTHYGLYRRASGGDEQEFRHVPFPHGKGNEAMTTLAKGGQEDLYVGVKFRGVYRLDTTGLKWTLVDGGGITDRVSCLHVDFSRRVWAVNLSKKTLVVFEGAETFDVTFEELNLGGVEIVGVTSDHHGGLWFSTRVNGVVHAFTDEMLRALQSKGEHLPAYHWFDKKSGLSTKAGSHTPAGILCSSDGSVWVAGNDGVSVLQPDLWLKNRERIDAFPVLIASCLLDGIPVREGIDLAVGEMGTIAVMPDIQKIEVQYGAINNSFLGEGSFRFRLKGYDADWVLAGTRTSAIYQNLPAGEYTFEVVAQHPDGGWSDQVSSIDFEVRDYWWHLKWLQLLIVAICIGGIVLGFRKRIQYLNRREAARAAFSQQLIESQEEERKRLASELHDGLGQDLLLIKNSSEMMKRRAEVLDSELEVLTNISEIASHAIAETRSITANLRPIELDRLGLSIAVQSMIERVEESCGFEIDSSLLELGGNWSGIAEINLYRIIQEALNNAVKHSKASDISVRSRLSGDRFFVEIQDNGCGFDIHSVQAYKNKNSLGLTGLDERVKILSGKLKITSDSQSGTLIRVDFPVTSVKKL